MLRVHDVSLEARAEEVSAGAALAYGYMSWQSVVIVLIVPGLYYLLLTVGVMYCTVLAINQYCNTVQCIYPVPVR